MKTIMQDIAKLAGVSPGTVSNALNNRKGVGKETKLKIIKIAEDLGYYQNHKKNEEKVIRLIIFKKHGYVVSPDTQFFSALMGAIENECRQEGCELLISQIIHGEHDKEDIFKIINHSKIDGVLLLATEMDDDDLSNFENIDTPVVILDSYFETKSHDYILINNINGSYGATKYFIDNGHIRIGLLASSKNIKNFTYRCVGFLKAINDSNLNFREEDRILVEPTLDGAYRDMKEFLLNFKGNLPTAIFALNDIIALGAIKAMQEQGIKIPEEVSIIGFDDIPFSSLINPSLTTIKVYTNEMGRLSVKRLLQKIKNRDEYVVPLKIEIDTKLIERDSVIVKK